MTSLLSQSASSEIHLIRIHKSYRTGLKAANVALREASLWIRRGETVSVVGPTGCGKSTMLRIVAGLDQPDEGAVTFDGEDVMDLTPSQRGIGLVFQNYALYPHFKVHGNIAFYFRLRRWKTQEIDSRVLETSRIMGIGFEKLLGRMPRSLSGGEKQRVALARCLSHNPRVLLLDEPFSNLDAALRLQTRGEVKRLVDQFGLTTIFVTHDQTEAISMGHRIAVMRQGTIEQVGTYQEIYHAPRNTFVAGFLGIPPMNFLAGHRQGEVIQGEIQGTHIAFPLPPPLQQRIGEGEAVTVGLRPEHLRLSSTEVSPGFPGTVAMVEVSLSDASQMVYLEHHGRTFCVKTDLQTPVRMGATLWVHLPSEQAHFFDKDEQRIAP